MANTERTGRGDLTKQERADFARRHASTEQALRVLEAYGDDPSINFATFMDAVRQIEQSAKRAPFRLIAP
jgi:hypothetical protein